MAIGEKVQLVSITAFTNFVLEAVLTNLRIGNTLDLVRLEGYTNVLLQMDRIAQSFPDEVPYNIKIELKTHLAKSVITEGKAEPKSVIQKYHKGAWRMRAPKTGIKRKVKLLKYVFEFKGEPIFVPNSYHMLMSNLSRDIRLILKQVGGTDRLFKPGKINRVKDNKALKLLSKNLEDPSELIIFESLIALDKGLDIDKKVKSTLVYQDFRKILDTPITFYANNVDGSKVTLTTSPHNLAKSIGPLETSLAKNRSELSKKEEIFKLFVDSIKSNNIKKDMLTNTLTRINNIPLTSTIHPDKKPVTQKIKANKEKGIKEIEEANDLLEEKVGIVQNEIDELQSNIEVLKTTIRQNRMNLAGSTDRILAAMHKYLGLEVRRSLKDLLKPNSKDF